MKKFLLSIVVIAGSVGYALYSSSNASASPAAAPTAAPSQTTNISIENTPTTSAPPAQPAPSPTVTPSPAPAPAASQGQYKDGTYTGSVANAYYGNVQVEAVISGGKIADVKFLQYPNTHMTSVYINSQAMPMLTEEALQVQSANVNTISGASETSRAFRESLANALAKA